MRALVMGLVELANPEALPPEHCWGSGSVGEDTPPRPFAVVRFGGRFQGIGPVVRRRLEVWIHDDEGSYDRIEDLLREVKAQLDGAEHVQGENGAEIVLCTWQSDSTDLYDDGYRTNCMMSTFEIVGKEAR